MSQLSPDQARVVLDQLLRAQLAKKATASGRDQFVADLFPLQREIIQHPGKRKALLAARRAGKTFAVLTALHLAAIGTPEVQCLYLAPTLKQAVEIIWTDLEAFIARHKLDVQLNRQTWTVTFPNGSTIKVDGCDTESDAVKFRGRRYKLVCIDEAGHFGNHLQSLLEQSIGPALGLSGDLWLLGTPEITSTGLFHDITNTDGYAGVWNVWKWTALQNPKHPDWINQPNWQDLVRSWWERVKEENRWDDETPAFRREYQGLWHRDQEVLVLAFDDSRNTFLELEARKEWRYLIGVDDGTVDEFAMALCAWSPTDPNFFVVDTFQGSHLSYDEKTSRIKDWSDRYKAHGIHIDSAAAGKQLILDLGNKYRLPVQAALKRDATRGRAHFIELLNDDVRQGRVKIQQGLRMTIQELKSLTWLDKATGTIAGKDHVFDAVRYAFHASGHIYFKAPKAEVSDMAKKMDAFWEAETQRIRDQREEDLMMGGLF